MERYTNPDCKPEMEELMKDCPRSRSGAECWLRLCDIEDILGDEYDPERLKELIKQTGGAKPMRLIDADAIKINYGGLAHIGPYDYEEISKYYLDQIKKQPTVDAVPVVRCRDCKWFNHYTMECESDDVATDHEGGASFSINFGPDDFCSYGQRKIETVLPKSDAKVESLEG